MAGGTQRRSPAVAAAVGLLLVVAAVGLAARPGVHLPRHEGLDPHVGRDFGLVITTMALGAVMVWQGRRFTVDYQRLTWRLVGLVLVVAPPLLVNVNRLADNGAPHSTPTASPTTTAASPLGPTGQATVDTGPPRGMVPKLSPAEGYSIISLVLTVVAIALLGMLGYRALRRAGRHVGATPLPEPTSAADVLHRASEAIALGTDPRGRVIAAYEAMESALGARSAPQAPLEWLAGLVESHGAALGPARELTAIFERARFSTADISDADAERARHLLSDLRRTLAAVPT